MKELKQAGVSKIVIERPHKKCRVTIHSARPGIIIGKKGADIEKLRRKLSEMTNSAKRTSTSLKCASRKSTQPGCPVDRPAAGAPCRVPPRHEARRSVGHAPRRRRHPINCGGRLGGAEIARTEWYREGRVPLHTLRADVDYGTAEARPLTGSAASRSGSSRAKSSSTIRWRLNAAPRKATLLGQSPARKRLILRRQIIREN
jgi:small subunit ribosomal protein S3